MMRTLSHSVALLGTLATVLAGCGAGVGPYQATGLKVGEVTDTSAIVWTRLTRRPKRNPADGPMVTIKLANEASGDVRKGQPIGVEYPEGVTVADIANAVPGSAGEVRVQYRPVGGKWLTTPWRPVETEWDCTRQFRLTDLTPDTRYELRVTGRAGADAPAGQTLTGSFRTAPRPERPAKVVFAVSTGQAYNDQDGPDGFAIYGQILKLDPSFFVHTGDIVYYDRLAKTLDLARYHWQRTYSLPSNVAFHRLVPSYFIKDDHDTWMNDCWPTKQTKFMYQFTFAQGLAEFPHQVPMGDSTIRTFRWGKDLQIWLPEGRDFRSPNNAPDGPEKTIWGAAQKAWFKKSVAESDATFRILISPTPLVGPDRPRKSDNHANAVFTHEGDELRQFIASQKNMVVICGDRHWQYLSVHPETKVREYGCGPASDKHAGGWRQDDFVKAYHRYLRVAGGFLAVTIDRAGGKPTATFRYYDPEGKVHYEDTLTAE